MTAIETRELPEKSSRLTWHMPRGDVAELAVQGDWPGAAFREWAWEGATGAGARVCVVDSGVERDHPLVGPVDAAYAVVPDGEGNLTVAPDTGGDSFGHGTACAGIIRALAPECELVSMRVVGGMFGTGDVLLAGLHWAVTQDFDVVNLSLSTSKRQFVETLRELADDAYFRNTVLVASAHNMPVESFPWRFSSVISVGSHSEANPWLLYYNPTPPVEFFARGVDVPVAWAGGGRRTRCSGNSFATPHVAGLVALIRSKHPGLTPFQIKTALHLVSSNVRRPA